MTDDPSVASLPSGNGATAPTPPTPEPRIVRRIIVELDMLADDWNERAESFAAGQYGAEFTAEARALASGLRWLAGSLPEMMADTRRLDWLEKNFGETGVIHQPTPLLWRVEPHSGMNHDAWTLREAIDAASSVPSSETPSND